jgi:hypothetical protein
MSLAVLPPGMLVLVVSCGGEDKGGINLKKRVGIGEEW